MTDPVELEEAAKQCDAAAELTSDTEGGRAIADRYRLAAQVLRAPQPSESLRWASIRDDADILRQFTNDGSDGSRARKAIARLEQAALAATASFDATVRLLPVTIKSPADERNGGCVVFPSGRWMVLSKEDAAALAAPPPTARPDREENETVRDWDVCRAVDAYRAPRNESDERTLADFLEERGLRVIANDSARPDRESAVPFERFAKYIYDTMPYDGFGDKPVWVNGGNSFKQDAARDLASAALAAQQPNQRGERETERVDDLLNFVAGSRLNSLDPELREAICTKIIALRNDQQSERKC